MRSIVSFFSRLFHHFFSKHITKTMFLLVITSCATTAANFEPPREVETILSDIAQDTNNDKHAFNNRPRTRSRNHAAYPEKRELKVALLVPLSGKSKTIGQAFLDAAQLAFFDLKSNEFTLLPIDTEGSVVGGKEAAKKAVEEKVDLILGPIYSNTTKAVSPIARLANINVISFSNDIAVGGNGVYLLGFRPEQQIEKIVEYASSRGIRDFAALVSNDNYGAMAARILRNTAKKYNGVVLKEEYYQPHNITTNTNTLRATKSVQNSLMASDSPSFKGLLIPAGGDSLAELSTLLNGRGLRDKKIQLLGSGQWDDHNTKTIDLVDGGWYAGVSPNKLKEFQRRFRRNFGYTPPRLSSLAYDAVALTMTLAKISRKHPFTQQALTNPRGFLGINGIFRLDSNGVSERGLAILQLSGGQARVIAPAPQNFTH